MCVDAPGVGSVPTGTDPKRLSEIATRERLQYTPGPDFFANGGGELLGDNYICAAHM